MSGLVLKLGPKERLLINGAVIENGDRRSRVTVLTSHAKILRLKDAIHPNEATTPVKRACYLTQLLLSGDMDPSRALAQLNDQIESLESAFTDEQSLGFLSAARAYLNDGNSYSLFEVFKTAYSSGGQFTWQGSIMTFQPIIIGDGLPAWSLLKRSLPVQQTLHSATFAIKSDTEYFQSRFQELNTADDLVSDRRILRVVLGAYGLSDDIENRHFIKTILEEGMTDSSALANKLTDQRYKTLAADFDFSVVPPKHKTQPELAAQTNERFRRQSFEEAVGAQNNDMRLTLTFQRTLEQLAESTSSNNAAWYQLMATPPLREVMQTALGLPQEFSNLDIDDQFERFQDKAKDVFGTSTLTELSSASVSDEIIQRFLVIRQSSQVSTSSSLETALVLLSGLGTSRS